MIENEIEYIELDLLKRSVYQEISEEEKAKVDAWLKISPRNRKYYSKISSALNHELLYNVSVEKEISQLTGFLNHIENSKKNNKKNIFLKRTSIAAGFLIPILIIVILWSLKNDKQEEVLITRYDNRVPVLITPDGQQHALEPQNESLLQVLGEKIVHEEQEIYYVTNDETEAMDWHTIYVPKGGEYKVVLADGSSVWINSDTEFTYPVNFNDTIREVKVFGEAYFEVSKGEKPFIVNAGQVDVRVYGTSFNVNNHNTKYIKTVLKEGSVGISSRTGLFEESILKPNEIIEVDVERGRCTIKEIEADIYTSWHLGYFSFEAERLDEIMDKLQRWYDMEVLFMNEEVKNRSFSGRIERFADIDDVLELLERTDLVKFDINERLIIVR